MAQNILVVAAHPDDEILGAGATLAKHVVNGDNVYCLILGQGQMSRIGAVADMVSSLQVDARASGKCIGFKEVYFADFADNAFDTVSLLAITQEVEKYFKQIKPDKVYTHYENDLNIDHRLTFQSVLTASRPCTDFFPKEILTFESLSSTEWQSNQGMTFAPNVYVDVSDTIDKKIDALKEYKTEIRDYPHPRSEEGMKILAKYRGLASGLKYAEAFYLIRKTLS